MIKIKIFSALMAKLPVSVLTIISYLANLFLDILIESPDWLEQILQGRMVDFNLNNILDLYLLNRLINSLEL